MGRTKSPTWVQANCRLKYTQTLRDSIDIQRGEFDVFELDWPVIIAEASHSAKRVTVGYRCCSKRTARGRMWFSPDRCKSYVCACWSLEEPLECAIKLIKWIRFTADAEWIAPLLSEPSLFISSVAKKFPFDQTLPVLGNINAGF